MKNKRRFWNNLPLFWKTFILSMLLASLVVLISEGAESVTQAITHYANIKIKLNIQEAMSWVIAIVVSSLAGSLTLSRIITGALTRIQPAVERLSQGDLDSRITGPDIERGDEIGGLGRSFNHMADNISKLLDSQRALIRDISHEIRSPLARMKMALTLLEQDAGHLKPVGRHSEQLEKDINRIEAMVEQMLARARLETMTYSGLEKDRLDLAILLSGSVKEQSLAISEKKYVQIEGLKSAPYLGNAVLLRRAVDNLIKNALHYTATDTTVTAKLSAKPEELILEISDRGPGVRNEHLEKIFRPFYRVDSARTRKSGGFGLGLAIAHQAVQLHGGRISARNIRPGDNDSPNAENETTGNCGLKIIMALPLISDTPKK